MGIELIKLNRENKKLEVWLDEHEEENWRCLKVNGPPAATPDEQQKPEVETSCHCNDNDR